MNNVAKKNKVFYGWYLLIAVWLLTATTTGMCVNSFNQFLKPVCEMFQINRAQFTIANSLISVCVMGMSPFVGKVFEKFKPSRVIKFGIVCVLFGWFGFSYAPNRWVFYLMALFVGFGSNFAGAVVTNIVLNNWFHAKKGFAMGFATTGSGFGSAIFNPIGGSFISNFGYQTAFVYMGIIALCCMLPIAILFRYKPEDIGLLPYGETSSDTADDKEGKAPAKVEKTGYMRSEAMKNPKFWGVCIIAFSLSAGAIGVFSQISPYLTDLGYDPVKAGTIISTISLTMAGAKIVFGSLNDKLGTYRNFLLLVGLSVIGMFSLQFIDNQKMAYVIAFLFGIAFSATNVLSPLITVHAMGEKDFANIFGIVSFALYAGPIIAGPFSGAIFDMFGSYKVAFTIYGCFYVMAFIIGAIVLRKGYSEEK